MRLSKHRLREICGRARRTSKQPLSPAIQAYLDGKPRRVVETAVAPSAEDRRHSGRLPVSSQVTVRRIGGFNFEVALSNISSGGCRVEMLEESEVGDTIIARFAKLEPLGSRICWSEGREIGVEFFNPIHPAVLDLLVERLPHA